VSIPLRALAFTFLFSAMAMEASAAGASAQSHPCASIADAAQRLACYDGAFPPGDTRTGSMDVETEKERGLREFGLNKVQMRALEPDRMRDVLPDRMEASVVRVSTLATGERVVTLDNDQIWRLTEGKSKGQLKSGDPVAIREAAMGTYMLVTPTRIHLRAKRVQ